MAPSRMKFIGRISVILLGIALTGCVSAQKAKLSPEPTAQAPLATRGAENPVPEKNPLPPRPRPYFGSPSMDYDPLSSPHQNLFDPSKLGQPDFCCPIHGFTPSTE